jgi:hypothetical protein
LGNLPISATDHPKAIRTSLPLTIAHIHIVQRDVISRSEDRTPGEPFYVISPPFPQTFG